MSVFQVAEIITLVNSSSFNDNNIITKMIANKLRRTILQSASDKVATRQFFQFNYPHSFMGVNNAFNNTPTKNNYAE